MTAEKSCRPRDLLNTASRDYPSAWSQADEFRAGRGAGLPDWPGWCYLPMGGWHAIASAARGPMSLDTIGAVARLAALGAWRCTQGIYRFDAALYDAIRETPVSGDIPSDVLYQLPEWSVYVETPGVAWMGSPMAGFFAHLEADANTGGAELRLLIDSDQGLIGLPLHLGAWSLAESLDRTISTAGRNASAAGLPGLPVPPDARQTIRDQVEPLVSLLLYLCSQAGEIGDGTRAPKRPEPIKTKRGLRLFPADRPTTWDVGVRMGAALRAAYHAAEVGQGGHHAGPRPHVRRAHWHGFWSGPRDADARKFALKWLPPIPVNLDLGDDLPAVVRPVR